MNQTLSSSSSFSSQEESGWTSYFDDFFSPNNDHITLSSSPPATISDAASCVGSRHERSSKKKLSFKKRRTWEFSLDDSLEDTASSPVNSPKVSEMRQLNINQKDEDSNNTRIPQKRSASTIWTELQIKKRNEMMEKENELNKRGLCLVPLSMLVNYAG